MADQNNNIWKRYNNKLPKIFLGTIYRLPNDAELADINNYNLKGQDIFEGFCYTIIGRGVETNKTKQQIFECIKRLIRKYPDNPEYKKALDLYLAEYEQLSTYNKLNADAAIPTTTTPKSGKWVGVVMVISVIGVLWMMAKNN